MRINTKINCTRVLASICIILIWLIGASIFGVSLWLLLDFWINQYIEATKELQEYKIYMYIVLAVTGSVIVFGFIGLFGTIKPNVVASVVFLAYVALILVALIVVVVLMYIFRVEIEESIQKSQLLATVIKTQYGKDQNDERVTNAIDFMQSELHCCGGVGFEDYKDSDWLTTLNKPELDENGRNMAPLSCCSQYFKYKSSVVTDYRYCQMYSSDPSNTDPYKPTEHIYKKGCGEAIVDFFRDKFAIMAGIGCAIAALLILTILFLSMLIYYLRQDPPILQSDDVVYEMARCQEKSPYPTRGTGPYANLYNT